MKLTKLVSQYTKENFPSYLALLAFQHICLNREPLARANYKIPSFFIFGPNSTGKTSLVQLIEPILPHKLTEDNKLVPIHDNDKTIANLTDSVCQARGAVVLDPVKWLRKEDRDQLKLFNDDIYENKVKEVKLKNKCDAERIPMTGVMYVFAGDYGYDIPDLTETLLTKNYWFPQQKSDLDAEEVMKMKDIFTQITTQDGRYTAEYSCLFQDLIRPIDIEEFGRDVKCFSKDLLQSYEKSGFNASRLIENYSVLLASLKHLLKTIGINEDDINDLVGDLREKVEEKCIEFAFNQIVNINPKSKKRFKLDPKKEDIVDFLCKTINEQEVKYIFLWLAFGNGDTNVYIDKNFLTKAKFTEKDFLKFGFVEAKDHVKLRSKTSEFDWFVESRTDGVAYGKSSRKPCLGIPLPKCPEKFQKTILEKLNKTLVGLNTELTCDSNIRKELDEYYRPNEAGIEVSNAQRSLAKLTPKRRKKGIDFINQLVHDGSSSNDTDTPTTSGSVMGTPKRQSQAKRKLESHFDDSSHESKKIQNSQETMENEQPNTENGAATK